MKTGEETIMHRQNGIKAQKKKGKQAEKKNKICRGRNKI